MHFFRIRPATWPTPQCLLDQRTLYGLGRSLGAGRAFVSDRAGSSSFSLADGANGGNASAPVTAIILLLAGKSVGHDPLEPLFGPPRFARRGWSRSAEPFGQAVVQKAAAMLAILTDDRCSDCRAVLVSGVRSPACRTTGAIDLRTLDRHHDAAVTRLIPDCPVARAGLCADGEYSKLRRVRSTLPAHPHRPSHLILLRDPECGITNSHLAKCGANAPYRFLHFG
jgi:hypothetical protein